MKPWTRRSMLYASVIIGAAFTWRWKKILRSRDRSSRRSVDASCRYRCWAGCIIDTSGAPRKSTTSDDASVGNQYPHMQIPASDLVIRGSEYVHRADLSRQTAVEPHAKPLNGEISTSASVTGNDVAEFPRTTDRGTRRGLRRGR